MYIFFYQWRNITYLLTYMPNSSQIQTNRTKESRQLVLSKSWPRKKKSWDFVCSQVCIVSNWSTNFIDGMSQLFQCMLTDSERANDFPLSSTKMTYIVNFCIAPYFHQLLIDELKNCIYYSLSFNESFMILRRHVKWI